MQPIKRYFCRHALLPNGWRRDVAIDIDGGGDLVAVSDGAQPRDATFLGEWVVPGMPNLHSHAFQRAMAGSAEHARGGGDDDFWSWRESMYALAERLDPETLSAVAAQLFAELLEGGYTTACEFHYVHHRVDGVAYAPADAMARALHAAASETGIGLTLLPAFYEVGGFDGRALAPRQRRFRHDLDGFLGLVESLRGLEGPQCAVGIAVHSLRAVTPASLHSLLASTAAARGPIHVHVAEQLREVDECLAIRGARPVEWLLDNASVDARWCAVHATHLSSAERARLAASEAVVGLCPSTEANLGDGLFGLREWRDCRGTFGIGSDSNVSRSAVHELRWLEYGQRLRELRRNVYAPRAGGSTGLALWCDALAGGASASGRAVGALLAGRRADFVVLDAAALALAGRTADTVLDAWLFDGERPAVSEVWVGGRRVVEAGKHVAAAAIEARYRGVLKRLIGA